MRVSTVQMKNAQRDRANEERTANARPELVENAENIEEYDTVFLGYPNWPAYHKLIQCTQIA